MPQRIPDGDEVYVTCPECRGSGRFGSGECPHCDGTGKVPVKPPTKTQREKELSAAEEYGRQLAEKNKPDLTGVVGTGAAIEIIADLYKLLIDKEILTQGDPWRDWTGSRTL
jgi:RecJ-like exonuclease